MSNRIVAATLAALSLAACGTSIREVAINRAPHALVPRSPEDVELFLASAPPRPYVEIAYFSAQQESGFSLDDRTAVLNKMRVHAAEMGCDGLVVIGPNDKVQGTWNRQGGSVQTLEGYNGTCIVYRDLSTGAQAADATADRE